MPLKQEILQQLSAAKGAFLSGETLAANLNVSRSAVWKMVKQLKDEGYEIRSVTNRGYLLAATSDILRADEISYRLLKAGERAEVVRFETVDSTNLEARRRAGKLDKPLIVLAETQTAGRGRFSRSFYSPAHTGLYMSLALPTRLRFTDAAFSTQAAAVAGMNAIKKLGGPDVQIKWVNDLYYRNKKICGILTEAISDMESGDVSCLVVGLGFNLTTADFPDDVAGKAGSIGSLPRGALCAEVALELLPYLCALPQTPWMPAYREHCLTLGREVRYTLNGVDYQGEAVRIDDLGRLIVRLESGLEMTLSSGEVSVKPTDKIIGA